MQLSYKMYRYKSTQKMRQHAKKICTMHFMSEPKHRLKQAREAAGYHSPAHAARDIPEIKQSTLNSNENGNRDISRKMAVVYGRAFNVDPGWILYGKRETPPPVMANTYSKETLVNVARRLSAAGVLPPIVDDSETVVQAFIQICDEEAQKLNGKKDPAELLKLSTLN